MLTARLPNQPYAVPADLDVLVNHLRLEGTADERALLAEYAKTAAQVWETRTRQAVMQAQYVTVLDRFRGTVSGLRGPIGELSKVEYQGETGTAAELEAAAYTVSALHPDTVLFPTAAQLPRLYPGAAEPVRLYYTAGAATVADVPPVTAQFIRLMVAHYYENPQAVAVGGNFSELPLGAEALIQMEREPILG